MASDYGGALSRLAAILPEDRFAEKIALTRESVRVLREVARVNPKNLPNRGDLAYSLVLLGDTMAASGTTSARSAAIARVWLSKRPC